MQKGPRIRCLVSCALRGDARGRSGVRPSRAGARWSGRGRGEHAQELPRRGPRLGVRGHSFKARKLEPITLRRLAIGSDVGKDGLESRVAGQAGLLTVSVVLSDATDGEKHMAWHGSHGKSTAHVITWYHYRVITDDGGNTGKQNFPILQYFYCHYMSFL
jgi:hypothetical protein